MEQIKVIDCHTHIFPDEIAERAISFLEDHYKMDWQCSGTYSDLIKSITDANIYKVLVFASSLKKSQVETVNTFIAGLPDERIIGFGSIHPDYEDYKQEIKRIVALGLRGIKLHPDFQNFAIDDSRMLKIYREIGDKFPVLIHIVDEVSDYSSPKRMARVLDLFPNVTFIAAHLGGYMRWNEASEHLVGRNIYLDTSSTLCKLSPNEAAKIILAHGSDKILFGTDYPAVSHKSELELFMKIPLSDDDRIKILSENAIKLFNLW